MSATDSSKRLPVYIVLDSSAKETPEQFEELEQCFFNIYNGICSNSRIASRIDLSLITYGGEAYNPIPLGPVTGPSARTQGPRLSWAPPSSR